MTDIQIIRDMLTRNRIAFLEEQREEGRYPKRSLGVPQEEGTDISVGENYPEIQRTGMQKSHVGYVDFHSTFYFDKDGALINIGCWE